MIYLHFPEYSQNIETVFADMEIGIGEGQMKIFISGSG